MCKEKACNIEPDKIIQDLMIPLIVQIIGSPPPY
jgi:hypothetical protein